jgi:hypothetical protein
MLKLQHNHLHDNLVRQEELFDSAVDECDLYSVAKKSKSWPCATIHELRMESFPVWYFSSVDASTSEIAHLLEILVRDYHERTDAENLLIPSVIELSLYFQCPEIQIMDAFEILKRKKFQLTLESNYAKVYVSNLAQERKTYDEDSVQTTDDNIDWRDITHDFYTDIVQPMRHRLAALFS